VLVFGEPQVERADNFGVELDGMMLVGLHTQAHRCCGKRRELILYDLDFRTSWCAALDAGDEGGQAFFHGDERVLCADRLAVQVHQNQPRLRAIGQ